MKSCLNQERNKAHLKRKSDWCMRNSLSIKFYLDSREYGMITPIFISTHRLFLNAYGFKISAITFAIITLLTDPRERLVVVNQNYVHIFSDSLLC